MQIVGCEEIQSKQALRFMRAFTKDSFLEDEDPDLAKSVNIVYSNLLKYHTDIVQETYVPEEKPEPVAPVEEKPQIEVKEEPAEENEAPKKRRKSRKSTEEQ